MPYPSLLMHWLDQHIRRVLLYFLTLVRVLYPEFGHLNVPDLPHAGPMAKNKPGRLQRRECEGPRHSLAWPTDFQPLASLSAFLAAHSSTSADDCAIAVWVDDQCLYPLHATPLRSLT